MAKNRDNVTNISDAQTTQPVTEAVAPAVNYLLVFRRNHPGNRCSYGIEGNAGIVVFDRGLIAGTVPTTSQTDLGGMPPSITLDCALVPVKVDNKTAKAEAAAVAAQAKADKAAERAAAAQQKIADKAAKAAAALKAAQEKVAQAAAKAGASTGAVADVPATE